MSTNISLIKYSVNVEKKLTEKNSVELDNTILLETIKKVLISKGYISKFSILEEDSKDTYEVDIIDLNRISEVMIFLKHKIREHMKKVNIDILSEEEEDQILNDLRIMLNFRNLLLQKKEKYNEYNNILVVLN